MNPDLEPMLTPDVAQEPVEKIHVEDDSEVRMACAQLYRAAKNSLELHRMVKYVDQLEGWVQAKITLAADYLECVSSNLEYDIVSATMEPEAAPVTPPMAEPEMVPATLEIDEDAAPNPEQQGEMAAQMTVKNGKIQNPNKPGTPEYAKWEAGQRKGAQAAKTTPAAGAPVKEGMLDMFKKKPQDMKQEQAKLRQDWLRSLMSKGMSRSEAGVIADQMAALGYKPNK